MVKKTATTFILGIIFFSCAKVGFREDWDLQLDKVEQGKLKLNGYYYLGDSVELYHPLFIFSNGIVCREFNRFKAISDTTSFEYFEIWMNNNQFRLNFKGQERNWGITEIQNSKIIWQYRRYDFN
jgi:hypothetical protein